MMFVSRAVQAVLMIGFFIAVTPYVDSFIPRTVAVTSYRHHLSFLPSSSSSAAVTITTTTTSLPATTSNAVSPAIKEGFIETVQQLKDEYGLFLIEKSAKDRLKTALENFERSADGKPSYSDCKDMFAGEWELLCTTAINQGGIDLPDLGPLKLIRDSIRKTANKYLKVQQRIRATRDDGSTVDRIDHVLEYDPPSELQDVLENLPEQLTKLNINPLQVTASKLILIHKATIESEYNPFLTKLQLQSVVLNVAGKSTILDPTGKDLLGINVPSIFASEFLNPAGEFETTYIDDTLRISKGKQGFGIDQLRVFIRKGSMATSGMDVDDFIDPEFDQDIESPSDVEVL